MTDDHFPHFERDKRVASVIWRAIQQNVWNRLLGRKGKRTQSVHNEVNLHEMKITLTSRTNQKLVFTHRSCTAVKTEPSSESETADIKVTNTLKALKKKYFKKY